MADNRSSTTVLGVRGNPDERAILEAAAEHAEAELLNRTIVTIPAKDWEASEAWINRPAETIPALNKLARVTPSWEK
jgi:uncharacterized protein (DUF1778 family)